MRGLILALAALALAACGAYSFPAGATPQTGTVSGRVVAIPCAPVEQPQQPCGGRPAANLELTFTNAGGASVASTTDSNGNYSVQLDPGTWKVATKGYMRLLSGPPSVTVKAGETVVANYVVDSGIRVPVISPGA
jgi:hypothetical protein